MYAKLHYSFQAPSICTRLLLGLVGANFVLEEGHSMRYAMRHAFVLTLLCLGLALATSIGFAQGVRQTSGTVDLLRVHDVGTGFGGPGNRLDGEVVIRLSSGNDFYGFPLRNGQNQLVHEGMLNLLLMAYENDWSVTIDYRFEEGKTNFVLFRVWLSR